MLVSKEFDYWWHESCCRHNTTLQNLHLDSNQIGFASATAIGQGLRCAKVHALLTFVVVFYVPRPECGRKCLIGVTLAYRGLLPLCDFSNFESWRSCRAWYWKVYDVSAFMLACLSFLRATVARATLYFIDLHQLCNLLTPDSVRPLFCRVMHLLRNTRLFLSDGIFLFRRHNSSLLKLNLKGNQIGDAGAAAIGVGMRFVNGS